MFISLIQANVINLKLKVYSTSRPPIFSSTGVIVGEKDSLVANNSLMFSGAILNKRCHSTVVMRG
jgi:hypothetical protein